MRGAATGGRAISPYPVHLVDTPRSRWTAGQVYGLGDALPEARVLERPLSAWREGAAPASGAVTGPAFLLGQDTFADPVMLRAFAATGARQSRPVRLARSPAGPGGQCDPLGRLPRDDLGRLLFDLWFVPAGQTLDPADEAALENAPGLDVDVRTRTFKLPADPELTGSTELVLTFAAGNCGPVAHWAEVVRMNLLAVGGRMIDEDKRRGLFRYLWASLRALSFHPDKTGPKLNVVGKRVSIHPSAVVEFSHLADGVRVGPGAVVRASFLGKGAHVGAQALVELACVGEGAEIQRQAMCTASTVYPRARSGGIVQFGLCGERSAQKMFAVGTDMRLGGKVRVPTPDGLRDVDVGYLGVCFGHRSFVGSGVWIAPGRVVPTGARLARPPELIVTKPGEGA